MSDVAADPGLTNHDGGGGANTPSPPRKVSGLATAAVIFVLAAGGVTVLALQSLHAMLEIEQLWATGIIVALAVASFIPIMPVIRSFVKARARRRAFIAGQLPSARAIAARGRQLALIGMGYSLSVLIGGILVLFVTANDGAIAHTFLRTNFITQSFVGVAKAFWVNIRVSVGAEVFVLIFGLIVAVMRMLEGPAGRPLRWLATLYVDIFRAIPSIIVLYMVGFGLSLAQVPIIKDLPPIWLAIFALTLTYTGYVAEVFRAGLESIHPSQWSAARSLGLSYGMTLRTVIVPQAIRRMVPPLMNDFIGLQKDTALIGVMGVTDAFLLSRFDASKFFNLSPVIVVAALFVIITIPQARFVDRLIAREQQRRAGG